MRTRFAGLILFGIAIVLSGCVERSYRPYYYRGGGYYGPYRYDRDHHHRRHDDDRDRFRDHYEDHR